MQLRRKRFDRPDEIRRVEKAHIELGELTIGRAIFEPGWRWSEHVNQLSVPRAARCITSAMWCPDTCTLR